MIYHRYEDLSQAISRNLWKVPGDVRLVVGVPRSGMIAALMLSELMGCPAATLDEFLLGRQMSCGGRGSIMRRMQEGRVLVLDDTVYEGKAMGRTRALIEASGRGEGVIYACVFAEGREAKEKVDIFFEDIYRESDGLHLYEWNILHHYTGKTEKSMWDIDGIMCKEPPKDTDREAYEAYLPEAVPMVIPTTRIGSIVTYRLKQYREVTEGWLRRYGISYDHLVMFDAISREARNCTETAAHYKGRHYAAADWAQLFYESDARQAPVIASIAGKPVYCYEDGRVYY